MLIQDDVGKIERVVLQKWRSYRDSSLSVGGVVYMECLELEMGSYTLAT